MTARTPVAPGYGAAWTPSHRVVAAGRFARMPPSRRLPAQTLDPVAAGLVALGVYALHGFQSSLDRDQATFVYGGQQLLHGTPPYRGIFNSVGPLGDMIAGLGILLGRPLGLDDLTGARVLYLLVSAACVAVLSVLAREAFASRAAGLLAPAVFLTFASFLKLATAGPREKTAMVLFLEIVLLLLLRRRWLAAGVFTALATSVWQPVLLPAAAAAAAAILTAAEPRLRAVARYVVGGLVPTAVLAGYFAVEGALKVAWWGFVVVNVGYTTQPTILDSWGLVTADYRWSLAPVLLGWVAALGLAARAVLRSGQRGGAPEVDAVDRNLLVLGSGTLASGLWSCYAINGGADLFVVLPFAALGVAGVLLALGRRVSPENARRLCAAGVTVAVACAGVEAVTTRDHRLPAERREDARMIAAVPPGSSVLSVYAPEVLVLLHRRNTSPWQLSNAAISSFLDDHLTGGLGGYADRISRLRPALIVVGRRATDEWLAPVLERQYTRVGRGDHWTWYASNTLGRDTLDHLRAIDSPGGAVTRPTLRGSRPTRQSFSP